jgi:glycosyltransferase involved in cell wall biosynthesis
VRLALGLDGRARTELADFRPDLVHVSTPDLLGFQAVNEARSCRIPVVGSFHTRFETYLRYYGLGALEPAVRAAVRSFYRRCDYVLAPSAALTRELKSRRLNGVRLWGRGVDRLQFDPARRNPEWRVANGFAEGDVVILFCGRLVMEKGLRSSRRR